jgi:hypothetical protein
MKKKFREITVDGEKYGWSIDTHSSSDCNFINIWHNKKIIYSDDITSDDIFTPKRIKDIIMNLKEII